MPSCVPACLYPPACLHMPDRLSVKRGFSRHTDPAAAVADLATQIAQPESVLTLFFCSSRYDLSVLGQALASRFSGVVIGCTSAGEVLSGQGYLKGSLVGVSLASPEIRVHPHLIPRLDAFDDTAAEALGQSLCGETGVMPGAAARLFGLLLVDGLSLCEETLTASLHNILHPLFGSVPLVGGSAGDDLAFSQTGVYWQGEFLSSAAVFLLFETTLPFKAFHTQHFEPTPIRLVITESCCATRTVSEINGIPAAQAYAEAIGVSVAELTPEVFATHPLMLKIGGQYYVRSLKQVNPDGSLVFFCAIDNGLVLTIGKGMALTRKLSTCLNGLQQDVPGLKLLLACDCIFRRLEIEQKGQQLALEAVIEPYPLIGFNTYGEQYASIHANQTLTGIALGG